MPPDDAPRPADLGDELEPHILPRQRRALERVATLLDEQRPAPSAEFFAGLGKRVRERADETPGRHGFSWGMAAALWLGSGLALLLVLAILIAIGEPGGR